MLFHLCCYIFLAVLFVEGFVQGAQQKEVIVALFVKRKIFHNGGPYSIDTSPLISRANQWLCFFKIKTYFMKELRELLC